MIHEQPGHCSRGNLCALRITKKPQALKWLEVHRTRIPPTLTLRLDGGGISYVFNSYHDEPPTSFGVDGITIEANDGVCREVLWDAPPADFPKWLDAEEMLRQAAGHAHGAVACGDFWVREWIHPVVQSVEHGSLERSYVEEVLIEGLVAAGAGRDWAAKIVKFELDDADAGRAYRLARR